MLCGDRNGLTADQYSASQPDVDSELLIKLLVQGTDISVSFSNLNVNSHNGWDNTILQWFVETDTG